MCLVVKQFTVWKNKRNLVTASSYSYVSASVNIDLYLDFSIFMVEDPGLLKDR
jgi:hypothetical protein